MSAIAKVLRALFMTRKSSWNFEKWELSKGDRAAISRLTILNTNECGEFIKTVYMRQTKFAFGTDLQPHGLYKEGNHRRGRNHL